MQENVESFVEYFGIEHCFEFTMGATRLMPEEFQRRVNSFVTNFLREHMPDRIGVLEPHLTGHAHLHNLTQMPFTSPNFDHEALAASRKAYKRKDFAESKRQWSRVKASMSPEHLAMWELLRKELPKYGLGSQISLAPVREGARAIARYFGKYLTKGIASRRDDWKNVRLVRYSGTNAAEVKPWKDSTPIRSGNRVYDHNRRDKVRAVAGCLGIDSSEGMKEAFGAKWYYFSRDLIDRVQLPVYRSLIHGDFDGVPCQLPPGTETRFDSDSDGIPGIPESFDPTKGRWRVVWPDESVHLPWRPPPGSLKEGAMTPQDVALYMLATRRPTRTWEGAPRMPLSDLERSP